MSDDDNKNSFGVEMSTKESKNRSLQTCERRLRCLIPYFFLCFFSTIKSTMTPSVKKPIVESNEAFLRMQKLAGII